MKKYLEWYVTGTIVMTNVNMILNKDSHERLFKDITNLIGINGSVFPSIHTMAFRLSFMSFINEYLLPITYGNPLSHSEFGEGKNENGDTCSSWFIDIDNTIIHVSIDETGSTIELPRGTSPGRLYNNTEQVH